MNELELWRCSLCKTERTWGQRSTIVRKDGAWLNCANCGRATLHQFTGETKLVPRDYHDFRARAAE